MEELAAAAAVRAMDIDSNAEEDSNLEMSSHAPWSTIATNTGLDTGAGRASWPPPTAHFPREKCCVPTIKMRKMLCQDTK
eukprot:1909543-Prymnesium_polylepis.1